jgi:hypothetical protein
MKVAASLLLLCLLPACSALQLQIQSKSAPKVALHMSQSPWINQVIKSLTATAIICSSLNGPAQAAPTSISVFESAVAALEQAETRSDSLDAMASVFEASGTKSLLAKTRFKYVSIL